jgi:hypothetical protein
MRCTRLCPLNPGVTTTLSERGKGSRGVVDVGRFSGWFCYDGGQTGDPCIALPRNYSGFSETSGTLLRPRSVTLPRFLGRAVWDSWPLGRWVTWLVGKDVQPLQNVKLVYQSCSWSWAARTLTWVPYRIKLNLSFASHCGLLLILIYYYSGLVFTYI